MRNINEIIADLKHNIEWSQPNVRYNNLIELVKELEQTLNPMSETISLPLENPETPMEVVINEMAQGNYEVQTVDETETSTIEEISAETVTVEETPTAEETSTPKKGRKPSAA
jgi:hypothetical protein